LRWYRNFNFNFKYTIQFAEQENHFLSRRCSYYVSWILLGTRKLDQQMLYRITIHSFRRVNWKIQTLTEKRVDLETKNSFNYNFIQLIITLSSRERSSWKSLRSLAYRRQEFKTKHQPLERAMQKWPKSRGPLGMRAMLVLNDMYTASSITGFLKFLSVNEVVKVSSGLPIFQITRLLQLLTTVTSEVWRNLWVIYWPPWNEPGLNCKTRTEHEYYIYILYYIYIDILKFYPKFTLCCEFAAWENGYFDVILSPFSFCKTK